MRMPDSCRLAPMLPLLLFAACADAPADNSRCVMREVADMAVLNAHGSPIVKVGINGAPAAFIVDTGAGFSTVTAEAVERFRLPVDMNRTGLVQGVTGSAFMYPATIDRLDLGTAATRQITMMEAGSFHHAIVDGLPLSGLFGSDFLVNYDVEFDLPAHHVSLYNEQRCNGGFAQPWAGLAFREDFDLRDGNKIALDAKLDGARLRMVLDSGARGTLIDLHTAASAGATRAAMRDDPRHEISGVDGHRLRTWIHRFGSIELGPDRINNPWIEVGDIQSDNLLGASFFRNHRVWISYAHRVMWVQPVGPVRVVQPAPAAAPDAARRS